MPVNNAFLDSFKLVGGSNFSKSPKINSERTYNMFVSEDFLTDTYGYFFNTALGDREGRAIFATQSQEESYLIVVVDEKVFELRQSSSQATDQVRFFSTRQIGTLDTFRGDVFIAENEGNQLAFCDQSKLYIFNFSDNSFVIAATPTGVIPNYVAYHNGYFIIADKQSNSWFLSRVNNGLDWNWGASNTPVNFQINTKAGRAVATLPVASRGNLVFALGRNVTEQWVTVPITNSPYQRSTSSNLDYGCLNAATIASSENFIVWLGANEKSQPILVASTGGAPEPIMTDGLAFRFEQLIRPDKATAFMVNIQNHWLYQITFYDPCDNFSLLFDFKTGLFFDATDENLNYHVLRDVAFFNNSYYGVSLNDGNLYQLSSNFYSYDYGTRGNFEKPRIRISDHLRPKKAGSLLDFAVKQVGITLEEGNDPKNIVPTPKYTPKVTCFASKNGGFDFGQNLGSKDLARLGDRSENKIRWESAGSSNDIVLKFVFSSFGAINATDGVFDFRPQKK